MNTPNKPTMSPVAALVFLLLLACSIPIVMMIWAASIWIARLVW